MKLLFDEGLSPRLVDLLDDLFPGSESALRNGLVGAGDLKILRYAASRGFVLVTTDSDFQKLWPRVDGSKIVILRSCNYPTTVAADLLRRHSIRIADLPSRNTAILVLDR